MTLYSLGDLSNAFVLRRQNVALNAEMNRLSQEMTSGYVADIPRHLGGNYSFLGDIERSLRVNAGHVIAAQEASTFTSTMQSVLENVQSRAQTLSSNALQAANSRVSGAVKSLSNSARGELDAMISALNGTVAGRALFAGTATDSAALASADIFISDLKTSLSGAASFADIVSIVDDWFFSPSGGFETRGYTGQAQALSPFVVGKGETVDLDLQANDPAIRTVLRNTALAALAADPDLGYALETQSALLFEAAEGLLSSQDRITRIRADLGYAEARIDESKVRLSSEKTNLEMARNELLGVDLYETATRLEQVQVQLESLYSATVKLNRLSLVNFLS